MGKFDRKFANAVRPGSFLTSNFTDYNGIVDMQGLAIPIELVGFFLAIAIAGASSLSTIPIDWDTRF